MEFYLALDPFRKFKDGWASKNLLSDPATYGQSGRKLWGCWHQILWLYPFYRLFRQHQLPVNKEQGEVLHRTLFSKYQQNCKTWRIESRTNKRPYFCKPLTGTWTCMRAKRGYDSDGIKTVVLSCQQLTVWHFFSKDSLMPLPIWRLQRPRYSLMGPFFFSNGDA